MVRLRRLGKKYSDFEEMSPAGRSQNVLYIIYQHILKDAGEPLSAVQIQERWPDRYRKNKPAAVTIAASLSRANWVEVHGFGSKRRSYSFCPPAPNSEG